MSLAAWQASILDEDGEVQSDVDVLVTDAESGLVVDLFSDRAGASPISNPVSTDVDGFVRFYAAEGRYNIAATKGALSRTWLDVTLQLIAANKTLVPVSAVGAPGIVDNVAVQSGVDVLRLAADSGGTSISGFDATGENARREFVLVNTGTGPLILLHNNSGSSAGNRLLLPGSDSFYLLPNASARIWQDDVSAAWRIV